MGLFTGTTDDFRQYVSVSVNFTMAALMPELNAVEASLLPRFLGDGVWAQIIASADSLLDPITEKGLIRARHLAKVAVARIAFARYIPFAEIQIGDDGITVTAVEGRKAAFQYQTDKLERRLFDEGWRAVDELITLVARNTAVFAGWPDSPYFAEHQTAVFKTPADFSRYYPIQDRWLTYWALRPFIRAVEEDRGEINLTRIDGLPSAVTPTQKEALKRRLHRALAYQSVIEAMPGLSIELNGANVQVNYASQYGNATYYQPPGKDHLTWVMANLQNQAALAWAGFEMAMDALQPALAGPDNRTSGLGLIGGGPVVML